MRIAGFVNDSITDGPGLRFTVFTQGCMHNCPGCHNPHTHDLAGGIEISVDQIIACMARNPLISGLTISGGEPFLQAAECAELARAAREKGYNVWVYSGWVYEDLTAKEDADVDSLLSCADVLVDGLYDQSGASIGADWRGSLNQRLIDLQESRKQNKTIFLGK